MISWRGCPFLWVFTLPTVGIVKLVVTTDEGELRYVGGVLLAHDFVELDLNIIGWFS